MPPKPPSVKNPALKTRKAVDALNAALQGFNDKRAMNSDDDAGDWVITALRVKGRVATVTATDGLGKVSIEVPITYEIIEANGRVDAQFGIDLMSALLTVDEERQVAGEPERDPLEQQAHALLGKGDAGALAALISAHPQPLWRGMVSRLLSEENKLAGELLAGIADLAALELADEVFIYAAAMGDVALLQRSAKLLTTEDLRPYGPVRSTVRGWKMRGFPAPAALAESAIGE